jgi:hypothetical protein
MAGLKAMGLINMYPDVDDYESDESNESTSTYITKEKKIELRQEFNWFLTDGFAKLKEEVDEDLLTLTLKEKCTMPAGSRPTHLSLYYDCIIHKIKNNLIVEKPFSKKAKSGKRRHGINYFQQNDKSC